MLAKTIGSLVNNIHKEVLFEALNGSSDLFYVKEYSAATGHFHFLYVNDAELRFLARVSGRLCLTLEDVIGKTDWDFLPAELAKTAENTELKVMRTKKSFKKTEKYSQLEEPISYLESLKCPRLNKAGEGIGISGITRNVTELMVTKENLTISEQNYRTLFDHTPNSVIQISPVYDEHGNIKDLIIGEYNKAFRKLCAAIPYPRFSGLSISMLFLKRRRISQLKNFWNDIVKHQDGGFHKKMRVVGYSGRERILEISASTLKDASGLITKAVLNIEDVTEKEKLNRENEYLANHDPLTGLYNRQKFLAELNKKLNHNNACGVVLYADLNGLKPINDTYQHKAGDQIIKNYAEIVRKVLRRGDIVARLSGGGDELCIYLPLHENAEIKKKLREEILLNRRKEINEKGAAKHDAVRMASIVAERIFANLRKPMILEVRDKITGAKKTLFLTFALAIGGYLIDKGEIVTAQEAVAKADIIMYEAKELSHVNNESVAVIKDKESKLVEVREKKSPKSDTDNPGNLL